jgi:type VI secretion system protein ImpK
LDEVILASDDPSRAEWMKLPLGHDLLGQPLLGEVFFERLEGLIRSAKDASKLADVLEVYLLCLTLGFEGKYSGEAKAELHALMERTRTRIEGIRQNRGRPLSPESQLPDDVSEGVAPKPDSAVLARVTVGVAISALILFLAAWIHLTSGVRQVLQSLK